MASYSRLEQINFQEWTFSHEENKFMIYFFVVCAFRNINVFRQTFLIQKNLHFRYLENGFPVMVTRPKQGASNKPSSSSNFHLHQVHKKFTVPCWVPFIPHTICLSVSSSSWWNSVSSAVSSYTMTCSLLKCLLAFQSVAST